MRLISGRHVIELLVFTTYAHGDVGLYNVCTWRCWSLQRMHMEMLVFTMYAHGDVGLYNVCTWRCWSLQRMHMEMLVFTTYAHGDVGLYNVCTYHLCKTRKTSVSNTHRHASFVCCLYK